MWPQEFKAMGKKMEDVDRTIDTEINQQFMAMLRASGLGNIYLQTLLLYPDCAKYGVDGLRRAAEGAEGFKSPEVKK